MTLFKNKYRVESTRLKGWDYTAAGLYFVTVCAKNRECFFGNVVNAEMCLSPIGEIVADEWQQTPRVRPYVELDEWIIMPNHVHGIIAIGNAADGQRGVVDVPRSVAAPPSVETLRRNVSTHGRNVSTDGRNVSTHGRNVPADRHNVPADRHNVPADHRNVSTDRHMVPTDPRNVSTSTTAPQPSRLVSRSLGAIIGQTKSVCTKRIRAAGFPEFEWQERFFDEIIWNEKALMNVRAYIFDNPAKWDTDKNNPASLWM